MYINPWSLLLVRERARRLRDRFAPHRAALHYAREHFFILIWDVDNNRGGGPGNCYRRLGLAMTKQSPTLPML